MIKETGLLSAVVKIWVMFPTGVTSLWGVSLP